VIVCRTGNSFHQQLGGVPTPDRFGRLSSDPEGLWVYCSFNWRLQILELQPAGKKRMSAEEFLRGHPVTDGCRFGPERLA